MDEPGLFGVPETRDRKAYDPPRLAVYGDLSRLTTSIGMTLAPDAGNPGKDAKTL